MVKHLKKISKEAKLRMESQRDTLKKYKDRIEQTDSAKKLVAPSKLEKTGKGANAAKAASANAAAN